MITILSLFPELLDINGDAHNALVLAQRARWAGWKAEVETVSVGETSAPAAPSVIVIGSGAEASLVPVLTALRSIEATLRGWVDAGIPLLAVGTGWELLSRGLELPDGTSLEGLSIFSGWSVPRARVSDDIVVDSPFGRLVGFENHAREYRSGEGAVALGTVVYGVGNSSLGPHAAEGEIAGSAIGTHLHGPVLAKNPTLADHLLVTATDGQYIPGNALAERADLSARFARESILDALGISAQSS
jgi:CobQ-like glutamine amidotransferase family enzyme